MGVFMKVHYFMLALVAIACLGFLLVSDTTIEALAGRGSHRHLALPDVTLAKYRIDPASSKFMAHAARGGLAWFKGHSHNLAVRDYGGTAELSLDALNPASLEMSVKADSLEETDAVFTPQQKQIINKELDEIVLESAKYPEIRFKSTSVTGEMTAPFSFKVRITGDLTLHGVTKQITIPASVTVGQESIRAIGEFEIDRKDFNVNATDAFHGLVRVKHDVKFEFDIVARRL
jgi:polyisoprenoid-binding protein YceI